MNGERRAKKGKELRNMQMMGWYKRQTWNWKSQLQKRITTYLW